jgi:hypothetical protein
LKLTLQSKVGSRKHKEEVMTVHDEKSSTQPVDGSSLARLRIREVALRQKAQQLQARAEHLERVGHAHVERMARRIDAHEKIVLGALVKKAGLAIPLRRETQQSNDDVSVPIRRGLDAQSTQYDRALILGALLWVSSALNRPSDANFTVPNPDQLRTDGQRVLDRVRC